MFLAEGEKARVPVWDVHGRMLTVALSARWHAYPKRFEWLAEHGFALEYTAGLNALHLLAEHTRAYAEAGIPVRYHGFFPDHEFGHRDPDVATVATSIHEDLLRHIHQTQGQVVTFHVGLNRTIPIDPGRAADNLARLVACGRELDITVCLENLRRGPTSDPETVLEWARRSGASITLDVGHAVSAARVERGEISVLDFIDMFSERLVEVHMYGKESDRHYPIEREEQIASVVQRLLRTKCNWWTIELDDYEEALTTRAILFRCVQRFA